MKPGLDVFMKTLFSHNPYQETPILRGLYFSSGRQEGNPYSTFTRKLGMADDKEVLPGTARGIVPARLLRTDPAPGPQPSRADQAGDGVERADGKPGAHGLDRPLRGPLRPAELFLRQEPPDDQRAPGGFPEDARAARGARDGPDRRRTSFRQGDSDGWRSRTATGGSRGSACARAFTWRRASRNATAGLSARGSCSPSTADSWTPCGPCPQPSRMSSSRRT